MIGSTRATRRAFLKAATAAGLALASRPVSGEETLAFAPEIGVCTGIDTAALLRAAGATYVEESVGRLLMPDQPDAVFAPKLKAAESCGLPVRAANSFLPGALKCVGDEADHAGVLAWAEIAFARARRVGIETITFGSSAARRIPKGFDPGRAKLQFVALLGKLAMLAEAHGVTVAVEPLNRGETNFIHTVAEGARLVAPVQHPRVGLTADIYHMLREDEPASALRDAGPLIRHVHLAEEEGRAAPGLAAGDFLPYFEALRDIGYAGPISIECRWQDLAQELPRAVDVLREQMSRVR